MKPRPVTAGVFFMCRSRSGWLVGVVGLVVGLLAALVAKRFCLVKARMIIEKLAL